MNYGKIYKRLIDRARFRQKDNDYYEKHHIIPRCMGGSDALSNIVALTGREHFIAHLCLMKMHTNVHGLVLAATMMAVYNTNMSRSKNRTYEWLRKRHSSVMKTYIGEKNSSFGSVWIYNLQVNLSKKVRKEELSIWQDSGWHCGRIVNFNKVKNCVRCGIRFYSPIGRKTCTDLCINELRLEKRKIKKKHKLDGREQEFLSLYNKKIKIYFIK
jgi:hypothetical protein